MTLEELKRLDMGAWKGEEFAGQTILTLEELLNCVENFPCINLELKAPVDRTKALCETGWWKPSAITAWGRGSDPLLL